MTIYGFILLLLAATFIATVKFSGKAAIKDDVGGFLLWLLPGLIIIPLLGVQLMIIDKCESKDKKEMLALADTVVFDENVREPYCYRFRCFGKWQYKFGSGFAKPSHVNWENMTCRIPVTKNSEKVVYYKTYQLPPEQRPDNIPFTTQYIEPYVAANTSWQKIYFEFFSADDLVSRYHPVGQLVYRPY